MREAEWLVQANITTFKHSAYQIAQCSCAYSLCRQSLSSMSCASNSCNHVIVVCCGTCSLWNFPSSSNKNHRPSAHSVPLPRAISVSNPLFPFFAPFLTATIVLVTFSPLPHPLHFTLTSFNGRLCSPIVRDTVPFGTGFPTYSIQDFLYSALHRSVVKSSFSSRMRVLQEAFWVRP